MLYPLLKIWIRLALNIFCKSRVVNGRGFLQKRGPGIITANHPNSFLDAIIIGAACKYPVYFLARGDAFNKPWHNRLLRLLQMIPVYRMQEGKENLGLNESAFGQSEAILRSGGIVLVFIEGVCVNKHVLQPFKKGAARIAFACRDLEKMWIAPLGIAYDSFSGVGKRVILQAGNPMLPAEIFGEEDAVKNMRHMNDVLYDKIGALIKIPEKQGVEKKRAVLQLPALVGIILHRPLYDFIKNVLKTKTKGTVFFDSVLFSALLIAYPVYLLLIAIILLLLGLGPIWVLCLMMLHPLTAWCATRLNGA